LFGLKAEGIFTKNGKYGNEKKQEKKAKKVLTNIRNMIKVS